MRKNYMNFNGDAERTVKIENFKSVTEFGENLVIDKNLYKGFMRKYSINVMPSEVLALYTALNRTYAFCKDGNLYFYSDEVGAEKVATIGGGAPLVAEVLFNGSSALLCVGEEQSFIINGEEKIALEFPFGSSIAVYNGRVFTAKNKTITFGGAFDFINYSVAKAVGVISVPEGAGEILKLVTQENNLIVVCENCAYRLTADENLVFKFIKYADFSHKVEDKTVKEIGGKIYFISKGKMCVLYGGNLSYKNTLFEKLSYTVIGDAVCFENKYLLPVNIGGKFYAYTFDTISGAECFEIASSGIISDSGYFADNDTLTLIKLTRSGTLAKQIWQSNSLDFLVNNKKLLSAIEIYLGGNATLEIFGDFGIYSVPLKKGCNIKKLSLPSKEFRFKLKASSLEEIVAKNFRIKYKILGG